MQGVNGQQQPVVYMLLVLEGGRCQFCGPAVAEAQCKTELQEWWPECAKAASLLLFSLSQYFSIGE